VVEVKKLEDNRREVIVKEETGGKYQFLLVRDPRKGYWTVDDVMVRQRTNGTRVTKSTTEVMDLLMTLRHFLGVWESGDRQEILAMTSPDLAGSLEKLPAPWLQALTHRIASVYEDGMARKPEANLNIDDAVVKLPSKNGHLMIKIVRSNGNWLVDDVEAHNHREDYHPGSVRRQADAVNSINAFLAAYQAEDHQRLQSLSTRKFYDSSLRLADLSIIELPAPDRAPEEFDIRAYEELLTFMIPAGHEILRVDLQERTDEDQDSEALPPGSPEAAAALTTRFVVRDVTLYERNTQRQRTLSSVFTAPTRASLFLKALRERDHQTLSLTSTDDFSRGTWNRVSDNLLGILVIPPFYDDGLKLTDSHTVGQRTELEFATAAGMVLSCRMVSENGILKVDDVQYPDNEGGVTSLRTRLELTIPVLEFAAAWRDGNLSELQKCSSTDFNRLVWGMLNDVPQQFSSLPQKLSAPVAGTRVTQERATVTLGDGSEAPTIASMIMEHGFWVVDEVRLFTSPDQQVGVREKLRSQIASRLLSGSYSTVLADNGDTIVRPLQNQTTSPDTAAIDTFGNPVKQQNAVSGESSFERATESTATHSASGSGSIQQVSGTTADLMNRGKVQHAVETRPEATPSRRPVRNAVYTIERADNAEGFAETPGARPSAIHQVSETTPSARPTVNSTAGSSAKSKSGYAVFGPQADRVAQTLDAPPVVDKAESDPAVQQPTPEFSYPPPIDMTPATDMNSRSTGRVGSQPGAATANASSMSAAKDTFLYFGPDHNPFGDTVPHKDSATGFPPAAVPPTATSPTAGSSSTALPKTLPQQRFVDPANHPIEIN
ncbi:MAG: hypothetical protein KDA89_24755, partial [Planctomycetaceae bacterium]|nr:hypothetical protein [Planctomycetaceae bacterium]